MRQALRTSFVLVEAHISLRVLLVFNRKILYGAPTKVVARSVPCSSCACYTPNATLTDIEIVRLAVGLTASKADNGTDSTPFDKIGQNRHGHIAPQLSAFTG
jgi:hypothetical protein